MGEDTVTSPTAPAASAPKNAMADLLDLDFGSSEPVATPVMSPPTSNSKSGPNYSADLFDMSSDMSSGGGSGVFDGMGGIGSMGGMSGMGGLNSGFQQNQNQNTATSPTASRNDAFGDLAGFGGFGQPVPVVSQPKPTSSTQSSTVNDLLDLF